MSLLKMSIQKRVSCRFSINEYLVTTRSDFIELSNICSEDIPLKSRTKKNSAKYFPESTCFFAYT